MSNKINITEDKLKSAIQIALGTYSVYSEKLESTLIHHIKALSVETFEDYMIKLGCDKIFTGEWIKDNEVISDYDLKICKDLFKKIGNK